MMRTEEEKEITEEKTEYWLNNWREEMRMDLQGIFTEKQIKIIEGYVYNHIIFRVNSLNKALNIK